MNYEEFKEYVDKTNKSIANKLKDNEEELAFYTQLVIRFNDICDEKIKLENALDEIEKYMNKHSEDLIDDYSLFSETSFYEELLEIIKKAKGE